MVGGEVGSFSAFMAQAGRIVICGDAGDGLGDSLYEAVIYVRGDKGVNYGRVMEVMGMISSAGFSKVSLIAELPPSGRK